MIVISLVADEYCQSNQERLCVTRDICSWSGLKGQRKPVFLASAVSRALDTDFVGSTLPRFYVDIGKVFEEAKHAQMQNITPL